MMLNMFSILLMLSLCCKTGPDCPHYYSKQLKKNVYTAVKTEPEFPGGIAQYHRFLNRNLRYPQEEVDIGSMQTLVNMKFVVDTDGQIKNITKNNKDNNIDFTPFEKEVIRVINVMPQWIPGKCNGRVVAAEFKLRLSVHPEIEE